MGDFTSIYPTENLNIWITIIPVVACTSFLAFLVLSTTYLISLKNKRTQEILNYSLKPSEINALKENVLKEIEKIRNDIENSETKDYSNSFMQLSFIARKHLDDLRNIRAKFKTKKELSVLQDQDFDNILGKFYEFEFGNTKDDKDKALQTVDDLIKVINKWN